MIPLRVRLRGFLCYKEEQEVAFDGASLWMLSGLNGSGKSAVFDAITYALFSHHRGGGANFAELINKESDSLLVEFDFRLEGEVYRARRTRRRAGAGTQEILRRVESNGKESWKSVEGTTSRDGFNAWVAEHIGLTYETFTSSVLLLQGRAEQLLNARPEERRRVLAGIVDLGRYERLHERALAERKELEKERDRLRDQLAALPPVGDEELAAAAEKIAAAAAARDRARAEVERLRDVRERAKAWVELQGRLEKARVRCTDAERLLADAAAIEAKVERLAELRAVLPAMQAVAEQRGRLVQAERRLQDLAVLRQRHAEQQTTLDNALRQARDKCTALRALIDGDQRKLDAVAAKLRTSTEEMARLQEYERHEAELARVRGELARLPADPERDVAQARAAQEALAAMDRAVPLVARFRAAREELRQAVGREAAARSGLAAVETRGKQLRAEADDLAARADAARRSLEQMADQAAKAQALLEQARASLREVTELEGARVCRACGQPITPGHVEEEKRKRGAEVRAAEARARAASDAHKAARATEQELRQQATEAAARLQEARDEHTRLRTELEQAGQEIARRRGECGQAFTDVPEPYRTNIAPTPPADWLATAYPAEADVAALRAEAAGLPAARRRVQEAEQVFRRWADLQVAESKSVQDLARLKADLPADHAALRREHTGLEAEQQSLQRGLDARRLELRDTEAEESRLTRQADELRTQELDLTLQAKKVEVVRQHAESVIVRTRKSLPEPWRAVAEKVGLADLSGWTTEQQELEREGVEARARELHRSRAALDGLRQELADLEAAQADYPEEARQGPAAVQALLDEAGRADRASEDELRTAHHHQKTLEAAREARRVAEEQLKTVEAEQAEAEILAELLGPRRLQLHLIRRAERQVVEFANAVLDRLSGGQLYLQLAGSADGEGPAARALDLLVYNRVTGEQPINVAFLSGSQKFRVAVSLALGLGQYASRRHRPIEAVIIDEGFGCLDHVGRQVMIQELQNLGRHMRCILLVSHQAEFAEAFERGYRFSLEEGTTRVRPYQK